MLKQSGGGIGKRAGQYLKECRMGRTGGQAGDTTKLDFLSFNPYRFKSCSDCKNNWKESLTRVNIFSIL